MESSESALMYNGQSIQIQRPPETIANLRKEIKKNFNLKHNEFTISIINTAGSKMPVRTQMDYKRALTYAGSQVVVNIEDNENLAEEDSEMIPIFKLSRGSNRVLLSSRGKAGQLKQDNLVEDIPEEVRCNICYYRLSEPMAAKCGHICCLKC